MPVRLRQELQGLPWGAGIVALSCGILECFATCCPCSSVSASLLCSSTNFSTATIFRRPPKSKKVGQLPSLRQFQFFDPTGYRSRGSRRVRVKGLSLRDPPRGAGVSTPATCGHWRAGWNQALQDGRSWNILRWRFHAPAKDWHGHAAVVRLILRNRKLAPRDRSPRTTGSPGNPVCRNFGQEPIGSMARTETARRLHRPRRVDRACQPPRT